MPLDRFVLILIVVIAAAALTVFVGAMLTATVRLPVAGGLLFVPLALIAYVVWRVIADRLSSGEDDHYDRIEK